MIAAPGLVIMVLSIILADLDGTFAAVRSSPWLLRRITPAILNVQAVIAGAAIVFLIWTAWRQAFRKVMTPLPLRNDKAQFWRVSRYFHWVIGILMFCLVPIGLFMSILPQTSADRAGFVAVHQALGVAVFILTAAVADVVPAPTCGYAESAISL